jgi:hypothetical protein
MVIREAADHSTTSGDGRPANNGSHVMPWSVLPKVGAGGTIVRVLRTVQYSNPRSPKSDLERKRSMGPFPSPSPIRVCVSWFCYRTPASQAGPGPEASPASMVSIVIMSASATFKFPRSLPVISSCPSLHLSDSRRVVVAILHRSSEARAEPPIHRQP